MITIVSMGMIIRNCHSERTVNLKEVKGYIDNPLTILWAKYIFKFGDIYHSNEALNLPLYTLFWKVHLSCYYSHFL